jgi:CelD/BcsL family acetyltransferase involved in cellulose biosynthesis
VDLAQSFEAYKAKFSSKTRSTIKRKVKRFAEHCGGAIDMRVYRFRHEIDEFFYAARSVSARTYQERLLDAGLPDTDEFRQRLRELAASDRVRGYILFCAGRPVSYLHCPVHDGVLVYQHLGYDADYAEWSVGTILQWCAFERIFAEGQFRMFDFTEGQSEHKRLFATGSIPCANVYFLRNTFRNRSLMQCQHAFSRFSMRAGDVLERLGLKSRIKKALRFGF